MLHTVHIPTLSVALLGKQSGCFDYALGDEVAAEPLSLLGRSVIVPFQKCFKSGVIIGMNDTSSIAPERLRKPLWVANQPLLPKPTWLAWQWMANYYHVDFYDWIRRWLPSRMQQLLSIRSQVLHYQWNLSVLDREKLNHPHDPDIESLHHSGLLACSQISQLHLMLAGIPTGKIAQWKKRQWISPSSNQPVAYLDALGRLMDQKTLLTRQADLGSFPNLTPAQMDAYLQLQKSMQEGKQVLLEGVTGCGKTRIYQRLAQEAIRRGEQVLWLVPEISLVAQTARELSDDGQACDTWYGELSDREKLKIWIKIRQGMPSIVLGTRSASTLPFLKLGLVIVDEEHDVAYKQLTHPYYHARDVAYVLSRAHQSALLLGSATPSLETLRNVTLKKLSLVRLERRFHPVNLPKQVILPISLRSDQNHILAPDAIMAIQKALEQKEHVLILLNRRGFAHQWVCQSCQQAVLCQGCEKAFILHKRRGQLRCPSCQILKPIPPSCPACGEKHFFSLGVGTERLEEQLSTAFVDTPIVRFDRDVIHNLRQFDEQRKRVEQYETAILLGTQMLAKGHNFSKVQQVILLEVDHAFHSLDIRAQERLAQLYTQVAGRAGRFHQQGAFLIQTKYPDQPIFKLLQAGGYHDCAQYLLEERERFHCYPYCRLAAIRVISVANKSELTVALRSIYEWIMRHRSPDLSVEYFLEEEGVQRKNFQSIGELRLRSLHTKRLHQLLSALKNQAWLKAELHARKAKLCIEMDPIFGG